MDTINTAPRYHVTVMREPSDGTYTVVGDDVCTGFTNRTDALNHRDSLRLAAAQRGRFVCHECCGP